MPERLKLWMDLLPFMALISGRPAPQPFITRMFETAIMSGFACFAGVVVTVKVMEKDITDIKSGQVKLEQNLTSGQRDLHNEIVASNLELKSEIRSIRSDLYVPRVQAPR